MTQKRGLIQGGSFFKLFGSREAFFRRGFTTAVLNVKGKVPDNSEELIMFVRVQRRSSRNLRRSDVGR